MQDIGADSHGASAEHHIVILINVGDGDGSYKQATGRGSSHSTQNAHHFSCRPASKMSTHIHIHAHKLYVSTSL